MSTEKKMITLISSDKETFEVEEAVAIQSETIKQMIEDSCADDGIPLPVVTGPILAKVIEYCKKHVGENKEDGSDEVKTDLKKWDADFVKLDQLMLFELIQAANYLNIKNLLDVTCQKVADNIKNIKDIPLIRKMFNVKNDFTPEEEQQVRSENAWAFE